MFYKHLLFDLWIEIEFFFQIIAVEASGIAEDTKKIVKINGFSDVIDVHHSYVEDISPDYKVDLIISEWMGTVLLVS